MRKPWWGGISLLLCTLAAFAAGGPGAVRKQVESSMLVTGTVYVEPDGSVSRFAIDQRQQLPSGVVGLIEKSVPGWKFEPVLVNGAAVKAKANMSLRIVAKKLDAERYQVAIGSASFGEDRTDEGVTSEKMTPPRYPSSAVHAGVSGTVYLVLRIGKDGQVEDAIAEQVNLKVIASERAMAQWREVFERSALAGAKK
ncbi:MAG: energy transducer TonB, partial [Gammaproteobacteria bacterium]|nr:energy transducer TonB [Gammaproteobacteria bacterium]